MSGRWGLCVVAENFPPLREPTLLSSDDLCSLTCHEDPSSFASVVGRWWAWGGWEGGVGSKGPEWDKYLINGIRN